MRASRQRRSNSSASSLKEKFHGNVCSFPSRYLCLFLAQPQCPATHDGPCLHAVSTACDQGEQHDSSPDSAVQRASAQSVRREDVVAAGGQEVIPCPPINIGADGILRTLPISLTDQKRRDDLYRRRKQLEALSSRQQNSLNSASGLSNLVSCAMRRDVFECPRSRFYVQVDWIVNTGRLGVTNLASISALAIYRKSRCGLAQSRWQNIHLKMEMEISLRCDDGLSTSR